MASRNSLLVVGAGNMGGAIVQALARRGIRLSFYDVDPAKVRALEKKTGLTGVPSLPKALPGFKTILLAIKPQSLPIFLKEAAGAFRPGQRVITILAGVTTQALARGIPARLRLVRAMPNTPALVGAGVTALAGKNKNDLSVARAIFSHMGSVVTVKEKMLNAVTALSGAGPAYVFRLIEILTRAGERQGFPKALAQNLVAETFKGALALLSSSNDSPETLRARVTSPGGVTEAALKKMAALGLEKSLVEGVAAGVRRGRELSP